MKIKIIYSYDGSKFLGSQTQPHGRSVEDKLNFALSHTGIFEKVISSSRTDKDVHAINQVSTTNCLDFWDLSRLKELLNRYTHPNLHIKQISRTDESFHVRFDAKARLYRYILNHDKYSPFLSKYCHFCKEINLNSLNQALEIFKGYHDFKYYMKTGSVVKSTKREIYDAFAYRYENLTIMKFKANGFLRAQVRMMVANALKSAYEDKVSELKDAFKSQKTITKMPAPASGLYLARIFY